MPSDRSHVTLFSTMLIKYVVQYFCYAKMAAKYAKYFLQ